MFDTPVSIQDILASYKTLGCCVGAASVIVVWIIITLISLWREIRYNHRMIVMVNSDGGTFQITYATVKQHIVRLLKRSFPQLTVKKVRVCRSWGRYGVKIVAKASDRADLKMLRDAVQPAVLDLVNNTLALEGMFSRIDITISALSRADDGADYPGSVPARPAEKAAAAEEPAPEEKPEEFTAAIPVLEDVTPFEASESEK